jgi:hypothetical protein
MIVCRGNNKLTTMTQGENVFDIKAIEAQIKINKEKQDEFAIEFAEWLEKQDWEIYHNNTAKELLIIYKEEKGL